MQHVPIPYFRLVRYYGLYSNHGNIPDSYKFQEEDEFKKEEVEVYSPKECKVCGTEKVHVLTYFDQRPIEERRASNLVEILKKHTKERRKRAA